MVGQGCDLKEHGCKYSEHYKFVSLKTNFKRAQLQRNNLISYFKILRNIQNTCGGMDIGQNRPD